MITRPLRWTRFRLCRPRPWSGRCHAGGKQRDILRRGRLLTQAAGACLACALMAIAFAWGGAMIIDLIFFGGGNPPPQNPPGAVRQRRGLFFALHGRGPAVGVGVVDAGTGFSSGPTRFAGHAQYDWQVSFVITVRVRLCWCRGWVIRAGGFSLLVSFVARGLTLGCSYPALETRRGLRGAPCRGGRGRVRAGVA